MSEAQGTSSMCKMKYINYVYISTITEMHYGALLNTPIVYNWSVHSRLLLRYDWNYTVGVF